MCLSIEWGSLHHVNEAWLELELEVVGVTCWSSAEFIVLGTVNSRSVLLTITSKTDVELFLD
jgi:hypothetical protein